MMTRDCCRLPAEPTPHTFYFRRRQHPFARARAAATMSKLSMAEMIQMYKKKDEPAAALTADTVLPGTTTLEKLGKLFSTRQ